MKLIIIIPARIGSKRFKGKVLKKLKDFPILYILIKRLQKVKFVDKIIVSTTKNSFF